MLHALCITKHLMRSSHTTCFLCSNSSSQSSSTPLCQHQPLVLLDVQQLQPLPYCLPSPTPSATGCLSALPHSSFQEASTSCHPSFKSHPAILTQEQCSEAAALRVAWPISHPSPPCLSGDHPSVNAMTPIWSL